jgi:hypothetical protein
MTDHPAPPRKKRGAPVGNTNALKHGFYSPRYRPVGSPMYDDSGLLDQIAVLSLYIHQVMLLSEEIHSIKDSLGIFRALSYSMACLNRLLRAQQLVSGGSQEEVNILRSSLSRILDQIYLDKLADLSKPDVQSKDA